MLAMDNKNATVTEISGTNPGLAPSLLRTLRNTVKAKAKADMKSASV